jgi:hypothetical protein
MPPRTGWRGASGGCPLKTGEDLTPPRISAGPNFVFGSRSRFVFGRSDHGTGKLIAKAPHYPAGESESSFFLVEANVARH